MLTSDDEEKNECLNIKQSKSRLKPVETLENEAEAEHNVQIDVVESWQVLMFKTRFSCN